MRVFDVSAGFSSGAYTTPEAKSNPSLMYASANLAAVRAVDPIDGGTPQLQSPAAALSPEYVVCLCMTNKFPPSSRVSEYAPN